MTYALYAPWTDNDFLNLASLPTIDLAFSVTGIGTLVATMPLPSVSGDPVEGGVYFSTPFLSPGSWLPVLRAAMNAIDPEAPVSAFWNVSYTPDAAGELPMRHRLNRTASGGPARTWQILWTHASTTFDREILGYGGTGDSPVFNDAQNYDSPWQVGRAWFNRYKPYLPRRPQHRGTHLFSGNYKGAQQIISVGSVTHDKNFEPPAVEGVRVFRDLSTGRADLIAQLPGLTLGDLNTPIEALWTAITIGRKPIRLIEDVYAAPTPSAVDYQIATREILRSMDALIKGDKNKPRYYDLQLQLQDYVAP
jgi:hypothetical protein